MRDMIRLGQVEPVRKRIGDATTALLGDTIALSDDDWAAPTALPGWSRARVATHLCRGADSMRAVVDALVDGLIQPPGPTPAERLSALESGVNRTGLDLQIDLDTSAGLLAGAFSEVDDWRLPARLPIGTFPVSALVLARLHEVVLHHVDLQLNLTPEQIDPVTASWLLQWASLWVNTKSSVPSLLLESDSGVVQELGTSPERPVVSGTSSALWAWITGRSDGTDLDGADGLTWPLLG